LSKEVEIMKKFLMVLALLALVSAPALAVDGPNVHGVLIVHDTGLAYTTDLPIPPLSDSPSVCSATDNEAPLGEERVWKVYAAFPAGSSPRLVSADWGIYFPPVGDGYITVETGGSPHPLTDFVQGQNGFPTASGGGIGQYFLHTATSLITELYWFGGWAYGGLTGTEVQVFATGPHPVQTTSIFVDDARPPNKDAISGYGTLGFGGPGYTPCPTGVVEGACCFPDGACLQLDPAVCIQQGGTFFGGPCLPNPCPIAVHGACCLPSGECQFTTPALCLGIGGVYQGNDIPCLPNPCHPIPVESRSWGQVKSIYR
jgi:hypothetical protein